MIHLSKYLVASLLFLLCGCQSADTFDEAGIGNADGGDTEQQDKRDEADTLLQALTVGQAAAQYLPGQVQTVTVKAFIVGAIKGNTIKGAVFSPPFTTDTNILLADSLNVTDTTVCMPLQLPKGTDARNLLNLKDNPQKVGTLLTVTARLETYFRIAGLKQPKVFEY